MALRAQTPRDQLDRVLVLVRRSLRYAWVAALIAAVGTAAAVAFALNRERVYQSSTVIMHREVIPQELLQGSAGFGGIANLDSRFREMVLAAPMLEKMISEFDLLPKVMAEKGMPGAIEKMRERVNFSSNRGSTFRISFRGNTPWLAQKVTARIAEELIAWEVKFQLDSVSATKDFLTEERVRAEKDLKRKEKALAEFLEEHPEFAMESADVVSGAAGASIRFGKEKTKEPSGPRDPRLRALERQRDRIRARLSDQPAPEPTDRPRTPEQQRAAQRVDLARTELVNAQAAVEEAKLRYTERHPDVVAAQRRAELAETRFKKAKADLAKAMGQPSPLDSRPMTAAEKAELKQELARLDREVASRRRELRAGAQPREDHKSREEGSWVVKLETDWAQLYRERQEARERYDQIETKAFTAEIVAASEAAGKGAQLTVVDPAFLPTRPAGAPRTMIVLAGMVVFGGFGALVALGLALVDDRIVGRWDVERLEAAEFLVEIPRAQTKRRKQLGGRGA